MTPLPPEKRLMLAVLTDAAATLRRVQAQHRRAIAEARAWFAATDPGWPFSFINVCDALGLDPARVRLLVARPARCTPPGRQAAARAVYGSTLPREEASR